MRLNRLSKNLTSPVKLSQPATQSSCASTGPPMGHGILNFIRQQATDRMSAVSEDPNSSYTSHMMNFSFPAPGQTRAHSWTPHDALANATLGHTTKNGAMHILDTPLDPVNFKPHYKHRSGNFVPVPVSSIHCPQTGVKPGKPRNVSGSSFSPYRSAAALKSASAVKRAMVEVPEATETAVTGKCCYHGYHYRGIRHS